MPTYFFTIHILHVHVPFSCAIAMQKKGFLTRPKRSSPLGQHVPRFHHVLNASKHHLSLPKKKHHLSLFWNISIKSFHLLFFITYPSPGKKKKKEAPFGILFKRPLLLYTFYTYIDTFYVSLLPLTFKSRLAIGINDHIFPMPPPLLNPVHRIPYFH